MSTVSGTPSGTYQSGRQRILDGSAQQSDGALAGAGDGGDPVRAGTASAAAPPILDPSRIGGRIDTLIDDQVATGRLTSDQAGVLKRVLGASATRSGADAPDANGLPSDEGAEAAVARGASDVTSANVPGASPTRPSPSETLAAFIQHLQRGSGPVVGYASDGSKSSDLTSSRLLDFNT